MNAFTRKDITEISARIQEAIDILNSAKDNLQIIEDIEQEKYENLTEGLQATERGQKLEEGYNILEDQVSNLDQIISEAEEVIESINAL